MLKVQMVIDKQIKSPIRTKTLATSSLMVAALVLLETLLIYSMASSLKSLVCPVVV